MKIWTPLDTTGSISPHELDDVARMHSKVNFTSNFYISDLLTDMVFAPEVAMAGER